MGLKPHIRWTHPFCLTLLDQRRLPLETRHVECRDPGEVADAIRDMVVRGAPAIGVTAAYGMALAIPHGGDVPVTELRRGLRKAAKTLKKARPTAVNLSWAVDRMLTLGKDLLGLGADAEGLSEAMVEEAQRIHQEDIQCCRAIGANGAPLIAKKARVLTHCNAGALATGGYGTALGVLRAAVEAKKKIKIFADETRPYLQGARLTVWELAQDGIDATLLCDGMAGALIARGGIDAVVVGADRIAGNGDTANKVGTYTLAVLARRHEVPFYVAAPISTFDAGLEDGSGIPIEERDPQEILGWGETRWAPEGTEALHIAFDVTPAELIEGIITEYGIIRPVDRDSVQEMLAKAGELR